MEKADCSDITVRTLPGGLTCDVCLIPLANVFVCFLVA